MKKFTVDAGADGKSVSLVNLPKSIKLIEESRRSYRAAGGIGLAQLQKDLGLGSKPRRRRNSGRQRKG